jgi:hypothetical protein
MSNNITSYVAKSARRSQFQNIDNGSINGYSAKWWEETRRMIDRGYRNFLRRRGLGDGNWKIAKYFQV